MRRKLGRVTGRASANISCRGSIQSSVGVFKYMLDVTLGYGYTVHYFPTVTEWKVFYIL